MHPHSSWRSGALLALLTLAPVTAVRAATLDISKTISFDTTVANTSALLADPVILPATYFTTQVDSFDTTLGTLTGVTFTWSLTGGFVATNGATPSGMSVSYVGNFLVNDLAIAKPLPSLESYSGGGGGGGGGNAGEPISAMFSSLSPFVVPVPTSDAAYSAFSGSSPVTMRWEAPLIYSGPGTQTDMTVLGQADLIVTYTYTPVPEVASLGLAVAGGASLLLRRRRRAI